MVCDDAEEPLWLLVERMVGQWNAWAVQPPFRCYPVLAEGEFAELSRTRGSDGAANGAEDGSEDEIADATQPGAGGDHQRGEELPRV